MIRDIWIVALTKGEADHMIKNAVQAWDWELKNGMVRFVEDVEQLEGSQPARVFLYGSYFKRTDWPAIEAAIVAKGHRSLLCR